ncbi:hypothetical protein [Streptomyces sp. RFCAC02]|uniref:hypothetical protein n=1 Tax=Streptomyces sp. RFCAC02 TaxID=2499143 RepID=UPI00143D9612|nr:hypothetical protein [Streptomyces sp. RFCAC02]
MAAPAGIGGRFSPSRAVVQPEELLHRRVDAGAVAGGDAEPGPAAGRRRVRPGGDLFGLRPAQYAAFETALCEALRLRAGACRSVEPEPTWSRQAQPLTA